MSKKREYGQFYTTTNPFDLVPFINWFQINNKDETIFEPFAGEKYIVKHIEDLFGKKNWMLYDIESKDDDIIEQDTLIKMPKGNMAITNPPYLGKSSASRRKIKWIQDNKYDDLYKYALSTMLDSFDYIAAIIPESFITSKEFKDRLDIVISLATVMFEDTDCPVCLALFSKNKSNNYQIWIMDDYIGDVNTLNNYKITSKYNLKMKFNDTKGRIGLQAIDSSIPNIRFLLGSNIDSSLIKHTSRSITRISIDCKYDSLTIIEKANEILEIYRNKTKDVYLTSFKNLRKDGKYRRRIDFKTARAILNKAIEMLDYEKNR